MQKVKQKGISLQLVYFSLVVLSLISRFSWASDSYQNAREEMIHIIEAEVRLTSLYIDKETLDERVLDAMSEVPRHQFVPSKLVGSAYKNRPVPIGYGQTISQPYIVAVMSDLLKPNADHKVLEIGTGSGYQAAVLAQLVEQVFSIEIIEKLGIEAGKRLKRLGYNNVNTRIGDGYYGWPEHAPFDTIVVTAVAGQIPPPLIQQLKPGGLMVIPVGNRFAVQQLVLVHKEITGKIVTRQILPVRFVPLTGGH